MTRRHRLLPCMVPPPATLSCASSCMCHDAAGLTCLVLGCNLAFLVRRRWHWLLPSLSHSPSACCCACGMMLCQHLPRLIPGHDAMSCDSCPLRASSCVRHNAAGLPLRGPGNEVSLLLFVRFSCVSRFCDTTPPSPFRTILSLALGHASPSLGLGHAPSPA